MKQRGIGDFYDKLSAQRACYRVIYDGLLKAFNRESLNQLFAAGMACDMTTNEVIEGLKGEGESDIRHLQCFIEQFGLPS
jgi:hypothetical protein